MKWKVQGGGWNPYLLGGLAGLLAVASAYATTVLLDSTSYLGASTTFVRFAGFIAQKLAPEHAEASDYFSRTGIRVDWQFMLVTGIFIGAFISSLSDRSFRLERVPPIWKEKKGGSLMKRAAWAFLGGVVAMTGARLASGCPSGHGLSGLMQLSLSAFVAMIMFFATGVFVATVIYRGRQ